MLRNIATQLHCVLGFCKAHRKLLLSIFVLVVVYSFITSVVASIKEKENNKPRITLHENLRLRNDPYSRHVKASKEVSGGNVFKGISEVEEAANNKQLSKVEAGRGFKVDKLTYSVYYLNPQAYRVLKDIGHEFNRRTGGEHFFTVTSLLRTVTAQKDLTKSNSNASKNISTHSYATSFDISYYRFDGVKQQNEKLQKVLEKILADFQEEKRVFVLKERKSTCFHVTVRPHKEV